MKQATRKILSLLLAVTMLCGLCVPSALAAESEYSDTQGHWAETAIDRWSGYGVVQGYGDAFQPDASVTRAQMATILANVLGLTETSGNPFIDVADGAWYAPGILRCYAAGVMQGDNSGNANPDRLITRQEAMVMLGRALCIAAEDAPDLSAFTDGSAVGGWAAPLVAALVKSGMVGGVGNGRLDPTGDMSRAALLTVLDRAVVQYINQSGAYKLTNKAGIILVAAGDVTLSGKTSADILVTPAADGKALAFDKATVTGSITVQADGAKITTKDSKLPGITTTGTGTTVEQPKATTGGGSSGGSSSGGGGGSSGGGGGGGDNTPDNLTVSEAKTVTGGTYQNITIASSVGDGTVTLDGVTIRGTLTVNGGGSNTVNLTACTVQGKVVLDKTGGEAPRLNLTNTPVAAIEAVKPAILEADAASAITAVTAKADVEVKGDHTAVAAITVPANAESAVEVTVTAGSVAKVEAKGATTVTGAAGSVAAVVAEAPVTVASDAVGKVEVPPTAGSGVTVAVTGNTALEVEVNSANGAAITGEDTSKIEVSTTLDTPPENITVGGNAVTHIHKWDGGTITIEATCKQAGLKTYTCTADGCTDPIATKTENIPALPHTKVIDPAVAATCATDGKTEGVHCSVCNTVLTAQKVVPALGHKWGAWTADGENHTRVCANDASHTETETHTEAVDPAVAATCTEAGKTEGKHCPVCNAILTAQETVPALGHDFTGEYLNDTDGHWHKCIRCDATDEKAAHTYGEATCTEITACTACGYEKPAGQHTWGEWVYVDETNHKHTCSVCSTTETKPHTWDEGVVTKEPTEDETGVKTFTCTDCGGTKAEVLPVVSANKITLTQTGSSIKASWTEFNYPNYAFRFVDSNGNFVGNYQWCNEGVAETAELALYIPRQESGSATYSLVLYAADADFKLGAELARLENAVEVTVSGDAVGYNIVFNDGQANKHTITWPENQQPAGIMHISAWYRNDVTNAGGCGSITPTLIENRALQDGDIFDLRILTEYKLDGQTVKATMTPASTKTYVAESTPTE